MSEAVRHHHEMPTPLDDILNRSGRPTSGGTLPPVLLGRWENGQFVIEFRSDDWLYVIDDNAPYELQSGGMVLKTGRTKDTFQDRIWGNPASLVGVWESRRISTDLDEEIETLSIHANGLYSSQTPSGIYYGKYTATATDWSTEEPRGYVTESGGVLTVYPPYSTFYSQPWSVSGTVLTLGGGQWNKVP